MKRLFVFLLATLVLLSLAACGVQTAPAPTPEQPSEQPVETPPVEDVTLDVVICRHGPDTEEWFLGSGMNGTSFVAKFEAENPGVKLRLEVISPDEAQHLVEERIAGGNAPDILNIADFYPFAADGLLMPVGDCCPDELYSDFFPAFLDESAIDGTVWALPCLASARAVFYNADLLEQAGVEIPATWAELEQVCQDILDYYDGDVLPWGVDMTADGIPQFFSCYAWGSGGGFVGEDGAWALNSPENAEAVRFAVGLVDKGFTNPNPAIENASALEELFAAGKLAMLTSDDRLPARVSDLGGSIRVAAACIPAAEGKVGSSEGEMDRLVVFRDDAAPDGAARSEAIGKFLRFFYDPENYVDWAGMEGFLPAVRSASERFSPSDPFRGCWPELMERCRFLPIDKPGWDEVCAGLYSVVQLSLIGGDTQAALDALQASVTTGS